MIEISYFEEVKRKLVHLSSLWMVAATNKPAVGTLHAVLAVFVRRRIFHALVKRHGNGGCQMRLDLHTLLGSHKNALAVDVRSKAHTLLGNLAQLREREDLKSAAIGQYRSVPIHKLVQSAHLVNQSVTGAQVQMVGVGKLNLAVDFSQLHRVDTALDGGTGANVHKHGRLNVPVYRVKNATARASLLLQQFKLL